MANHRRYVIKKNNLGSKYFDRMHLATISKSRIGISIFAVPCAIESRNCRFSWKEIGDCRVGQIDVWAILRRLTADVR